MNAGRAMSYGDRNMRKMPGEFGPVDLMGMGLSAAAGIIAAIVFDLTQHDEGSALFLINKWVARVTEMVGLGSIPLYGVVLLLMGLGAMSILYFQPVTMRGAFAQGFGALAALTTIAPSDLGTALPGAQDEALPPAFIEDAPEFGAIPASYAVSAAATTMQAREGYGVRMRIVFPDGLADDIEQMVDDGTLRGRLYNEETRRSYNLFLSGGGELDYEGGVLRVATRLPGGAAQADLTVRIEAAGYGLRTESVRVSQGPNPVWTIEMEPSGTPLFLQRMGNAYKF